MEPNIYGAKGEDCWAIPCSKKTTHKLVTLVEDSDIGDFEQHTWYCFDHALHFFAWLPYVYGNKVVSLTPSWEDFRSDWMNK